MGAVRRVAEDHDVRGTARESLPQDASSWRAEAGDVHSLDEVEGAPVVDDRPLRARVEALAFQRDPRDLEAGGRRAGGQGEPVDAVGRAVADPERPGLAAAGEGR